MTEKLNTPQERDGDTGFKFLLSLARAEVDNAHQFHRTVFKVLYGHTVSHNDRKKCIMN